MRLLLVCVALAALTKILSPSLSSGLLTATLSSPLRPTSTSTLRISFVASL